MISYKFCNLRSTVYNFFHKYIYLIFIFRAYMCSHDSLAIFFGIFRTKYIFEKYVDILYGTYLPHASISMEYCFQENLRFQKFPPMVRASLPAPQRSPKSSGPKNMQHRASAPPSHAGKVTGSKTSLALQFLSARHVILIGRMGS
jgi:hypothetical protein